MSGLMEFDELVAWICDRVGLDAGEVCRQMSLRELDSLQLAELWIASEDLGLDLPVDLFTTLSTMGDFFYYYETKMSARPAPTIR